MLQRGNLFLWALGKSAEQPSAVHLAPYYWIDEATDNSPAIPLTNSVPDTRRLAAKIRVRSKTDRLQRPGIEQILSSFRIRSQHDARFQKTERRFALAAWPR